MPRFILYLCILVLLSALSVSTAYATSNQYGASGLISQPTAQTLNEGNICIGLWANCSDGIDTPSSASGDGAVIVPTTLTMGLGTFIEAYGSYPNMPFNGD